MPDVEVQEEDVKVLKQELSQFTLTGKHHTLAFQYLTHLGYGLESFYKRKIGNSQFRLSIMEIKDEKRQHSVGSHSNTRHLTATFSTLPISTLRNRLS